MKNLRTQYKFMKLFLMIQASEQKNGVLNV